jgi:hypothetical protein
VILSVSECGSPAWSDVAMVAVFLFFVTAPFIVMLWIGMRD